MSITVNDVDRIHDETISHIKRGMHRFEVNLDNLSEDVFEISGVALEEGTFQGRYFPEKEIEAATHTLIGKPVVVDHKKGVKDIVGQVTNSWFEDSQLKFEAEIINDEVAELIMRNLVNGVSVGANYEPEFDENIDVYEIATDITFYELALTTQPAFENGIREELSKRDDLDYDILDDINKVNEDRNVAIVTKVSEGRKLLEGNQELDANIYYLPEDKRYEEIANELKNVENDYTRYSIWNPEYTGTTEKSWERKTFEDFKKELGEDIEPNDIRRYFLGCRGEPPVENFGDLILGCVEPNGDLNVNALQAIRGGRGVQRLDPSASNEMIEDVFRITARLANEEFDRDWESSFEELSKESELMRDKIDYIDLENVDFNKFAAVLSTMFGVPTSDVLSMFGDLKDEGGVSGDDVVTDINIGGFVNFISELFNVKERLAKDYIYDSLKIELTESVDGEKTTQEEVQFMSEKSDKETNEEEETEETSEENKNEEEEKEEENEEEETSEDEKTEIDIDEITSKIAKDVKSEITEDIKEDLKKDIKSEIDESVKEETDNVKSDITDAVKTAVGDVVKDMRETEKKETEKKETEEKPENKGEETPEKKEEETPSEEETPEESSGDEPDEDISAADVMKAWYDKKV